MIVSHHVKTGSRLRFCRFRPLYCCTNLTTGLSVSYHHCISTALISGGFVPREPILDGPFYESKYEAPYHTTGLNIPEAHMPVDITVGTIIPPSITMLPKTVDG
jgi:hypothetical protein